MDNNELNKVNETELEEVAGGAGSYLYYTVVKGDTLTKIAQRYRCTIQSIMKLNPTITNPDFIKIGWTLKIPR